MGFSEGSMSAQREHVAQWKDRENATRGVKSRTRRRGETGWWGVLSGAVREWQVGDGEKSMEGGCEAEVSGIPL